MFLSRTRASPVEIYYLPYGPASLPPEFLRLICDHISHCVHICIRQAYPSYLSIVLEGLSRSQAPMLRSIDLGITRNFYPPEPVFNAHLPPIWAPLLTIAHLTWIQASDLPFCLPAFENVTSLNLTDLYINDKEEKECASFRDTLMAMPALYYL